MGWSRFGVRPYQLWCALFCLHRDVGNQPRVPRMSNVPHAKAHTTPTHPPRQPRHLRAGTSLGFKQLRSLNYKRPFFKTRTHNEPPNFKWNCDPSPRQHSAAAERLNPGTALAVDDGSSFYSYFNRAIIKTAVLALRGSVRHGGIRALLIAAALSTATAMPLRPNSPEPDSGDEEEEKPSDGSKSDDEGVDATATAPPEAKATASLPGLCSIGVRPGPSGKAGGRSCGFARPSRHRHRQRRPTA